MITAEIKHKYIKESQLTKEYTYYHCTRRNKKIKCNQKSIRIEDLETQIIDILSIIEIRKEFKQWAVKVLKNNCNKEMDKKLKVLSNINKSLTLEEKKLNNLTDLLLDETLSKDEFSIKKESIKVNIERLKDERNNIDLNSQKLLENMEGIFEFACNAKEKFLN
jgi:site-specific DNA recombinase